MIGAIGAGIWTARRIEQAARETGSAVLRCTELHFSVDAVTHAGVILAILVTALTGWTAADAVAAIGVVVYVAVEAGKAAGSAVSDLLDAQLAGSDRRRVIEELDEHRHEFINYHRLRTRRAGSEKHVDLHITICRYRTIEESHRLADHLENAIEALLPQSVAIIHVDPCREGVDCPGAEACELARARRGVIPESDWPPHPTGADARESERREHGEGEGE
jgi:cation diffusion facilitator family transporter